MLFHLSFEVTPRLQQDHQAKHMNESDAEGDVRARALEATPRTVSTVYESTLVGHDTDSRPCEAGAHNHQPARIFWMRGIVKIPHHVSSVASEIFGTSSPYWHFQVMRKF